MFDLDAHILRWRRSLATWGIGKDRLNELEEHLRDSIDARIANGAEEKDAFIEARNALGDPLLLKQEYQAELVSRFFDSTLNVLQSFSVLRAGALITLVAFILLFVAIENGPVGPYQSLIYSWLPSLVWLTSILAAMAVWASLKSLEDKTYRRALRVLVVVFVVSGLLLYTTPHSSGWSGASWVHIGLILSYFLRGRRLVIGAIIAWLSITVAVFVWTIQGPQLATSPSTIAHVTRLIVDSLPAAIMIFGLSAAKNAVQQLPHRLAHG